MHDPDDVEIDRIYQKFEARFGGEANYGKPVVLGGGQKFVPLKITPAESDFFQTCDQLRDYILAAWRVPKQVAGIEPSGGDLSWYAPLQQFCRDAIAPRLSRLGHYLTQGLAKLYDDDLRVWWDDPTPDSPDQVNADMKTDSEIGVRTTNEYRAVRGLEASDDPNAEKILIPSGMKLLEKAGEDEKPQQHQISFPGGQPGQGGGPPAPPRKDYRPPRRPAAVGRKSLERLARAYVEAERALPAPPDRPYAPVIKVETPPAEVKVFVPEQAPPVVNVAAPLAPVVNVSVPEQAPPTVNVAAPQVKVDVPRQARPEIVINVPEQAPPVVKVTAAAPDVHVHVPPPRPVRREVERDARGNVVAVTEAPVEE